MASCQAMHHPIDIQGCTYTVSAVVVKTGLEIFDLGPLTAHQNSFCMSVIPDLSRAFKKVFVLNMVVLNSGQPLHWFQLLSESRFCKVASPVHPLNTGSAEAVLQGRGEDYEGRNLFLDSLSALGLDRPGFEEGEVRPRPLAYQFPLALLGEAAPNGFSLLCVFSLSYGPLLSDRRGIPGIQQLRLYMKKRPIELGRV